MWSSPYKLGRDFSDAGSYYLFSGVGFMLADDEVFFQLYDEYGLSCTPLVSHYTSFNFLYIHLCTPHNKA